MTNYLGVELHDYLARSMRRVRLRTVRKVSENGDKVDAKKLQTTLAKIEKQYGKGILAPVKMMADRNDVRCVTTGFQALDDIISGKTDRINGVRKWVKGSGRGVPRGRIIEIFGPESSGKTTFALNLVAAFQSLGLRCAFIDAEHAIDMDYADQVGCDTESWFYSQGGESAEQTLDVVDKLVKDDVMDLIIVDSVAALTPKAELEGDIGQHHVGVHARLMSQALRKINAHLKRNARTLVVFINQTRMKIGVMFGDPETTTGGNALKFYASVRFRISSMGLIKSGPEKGQRSKVKIRKTKIGVPGGECFIDITGGNGITAAYTSNPRAADNRKAKKTKGGDDDDD